MNTEKNKKRTIANLINGKRKTVTDAVIKKYDWTTEELKIIETYRVRKKPIELKKEPEENDVMLNDVLGVIDKI